MTTSGHDVNPERRSERGSLLGDLVVIESPLDRYLLNSSMMDPFRLEDDGSLVLYIAKDPLGKELEPNWRPAPGGSFS